MLKTPAKPANRDPKGQQVDRSSTNRGEPESKRGRFRVWLKACAVLVVLVSAVTAIGGAVIRAMPQPEGVASLTHTVTRGDLLVTVTEQGTLESSNNVEVRSKVWGWKTVNWVIESGSDVKKGDVLVRLDASEMEKKVDEAKINLENSRADMITVESNVAVAEKSIIEYEQATFIEEQGTIKQEIFDAEQAVSQAELAYNSTLRMVAKGLFKPLQLRGEKFKLDSARQKLELKKTRLKALQQFKKEKELERLRSDLRAAKARLEAARARVDLNQTQLDQVEEQLRFHTISAPQDGMVIHPKAAEWRDAPDVEEGANVHTNQVLLIMPDLTQLQVKVGIHESMIDRVEPGLIANITIGETRIVGEVSEVAKVTKPATWYTGNVVKFDTVVSLQGRQGLKPGLSAEVEVIIADHRDVLTIPVAAVIESGDERYCWVKHNGEARRRDLEVGDSNDLFVIVETGLREGDQVVLNPIAYLDEAEELAMKPLDRTTQDIKQTADSTEPPEEMDPEPPQND
jgi:RND family efflux transporter MFP subunit